MGAAYLTLEGFLPWAHFSSQSLHISAVERPSIWSLESPCPSRSAQSFLLGTTGPERGDVFPLWPLPMALLSDSGGSTNLPAHSGHVAWGSFLQARPVVASAGLHPYLVSLGQPQVGHYSPL